MEDLTLPKQEGPGVILQRGQQMAGRTWQQSSLRRGEEGGIDIRVAHQLPGKPAEGHAPHYHFDKRYSDLKIF